MFLDVDGTLLELAHRPDAVRLNVNLLQVLPKLHKRLGGALALVSGRMIADLDTLFMPLHLPAAGLHGMERRDASGLLHSAGSVHLLEDIRGPLRRFAETHDGILLEDKGAALALHFRQAPELEAEAHGFVRDLVAHREDLHYLAGKMVFEIKSHKIDKGNAIACFLEEPPFVGRLPVFVGDDITDEDGFRYVNQRGGLSIRVGGAKISAARYRIADVSAVLVWLNDVAEKPEDTGP